MKPNTTLKFARMDAGFTREGLANALGVSPMTIYRWERGENCPSPYFRARLRKLLQLPEQAFGAQETAEEETRSRDSLSSFLIDPCLPISQMAPVGQQSLLKEIGQRPDRPTIGLIGLPGSGKTAIAQALTNLPDMRRQVEGVFWAVIGQEPNHLRHLHRWLMLLGGEKSVSEQREEVQDRLCLLLRGRKILIVLDDLWRTDDILPYHFPHCRYIITTRLPAVASTVCDLIYRPRALTGRQAFHLLSHGLSPIVVREHSEVLQALTQQVGNLPLAVEQMGKYLHREARVASQRRFQEALTRLFQPATYLHLEDIPGSFSLAASIKRSEARLSVSARHALASLATHFPAAPASFSERQVMDLIQVSHQFQLPDFDQLVDAGLVTTTERNQYHMHPVIVAYARLLTKTEQEAAE